MIELNMAKFNVKNPQTGEFEPLDGASQAKVQSDWNQTDNSAEDFIKNKPSLYTKTQTNALLDEKVDKETGKGLSTNDFTDAYKKALDGVNNTLNLKADLIDGKVPASQMPSYVDDTIEGYYYQGAFYEDSAHTTAITGERGKIYVDLIENKTYRWTGTIYTRIDECPAFGETQGTIYEGNKGKANADAIGTIANLTTTATDLVNAVNELNSGKVDKNGTDSLMTAAEHTKLSSIESGAEVNVQSDWNQNDNTSLDYIKNKPTIPAAQVNSDWTASSGAAEILNKPSLGTAAAKDYTTSVSGLSDDLITSRAVNTALADKADKSTTYTKNEIDTSLAEKLNIADVDDALNSTSTNPVQNKIVKNAIDGKQDTLTTAQLAAVNSGITAELTQKILEADIDYSKCVGIQIDFANKSSKKLGAAADSNFNFNSYSTFSRRKLCTIDHSTGIPTHITSYTGTPPNGLMVEQPAFYYKVVPQITRTLANGTVVVDKADYWISDISRAGFKLHPAFINSSKNESPFYYIGAWAISGAESADDPHNAQDDSLSNRGIYGADGHLTSIYNYQPTSNHTRDWFRKGGTGVGTFANPKWGIVNAPVAAAEQLLMLIEFGPNLQTNLASGITSVTDNPSLNCSAYCGSTFSKGLVSGSADSTSFKANITTNNNKSYSYRGVEDFYGNIWEWIDGMNIWGNGSLGGGKVFICSDWKYADDKKDDNYADTGIILPNSDGYIKSFAYSSVYDWLLITGEVGGDSASPIGDYIYKTSNLNGFRCALLGGGWSAGLQAGPCYWHLISGSSDASRGIGARLIYVP